MWSLLFQKGTLLAGFAFFSVFSESRSQYWSYDHVRHTKIISRTFLTNPWEQIFDLRSQIFFETYEVAKFERFFSFGCRNESKMTSKISKIIFFKSKKSNFHFISTNHSRMNCNLSSTLKSIIFAFLRPLHWGKAAFTDCIRLEMTQKWPQKFQKLIFEVKNQIFIFSQQTISRMYCNWSNILISIMFALSWPLHWGKAAFTDWTRLQMTQTWPQKFRKSVFGVKNSSLFFDSIHHRRMCWNLWNWLQSAMFAFTLFRRLLTQR